MFKLSKKETLVINKLLVHLSGTRLANICFDVKQSLQNHQSPQNLLPFINKQPTYSAR